MKREPIARKLTDGLQHPRLLKEMIGSRKKRQLATASQRSDRLFIEVDDHVVFTTDDQ
jgi:hypothetical protein